MKATPNGPPVKLLRVERHELDGDGDAEGGDRQVVGAQAQRERADGEARRGR